MRVNGKVLFSLLSVGILACVASTGTWAYFQDSIQSNGNGIQTATLVTQYSTDSGNTWHTVPVSSGSFTIHNVVLEGIVPSTSSVRKPAQKLWIRNLNDHTDAKIHILITPDPTTVDVIPGLTIYIGDTLGFPQKIYDGTKNNGFITTYTTTGFDMGTPIPAGDSDPRVYDVSYIFIDDLTNQNQYERKEVGFDITVTVTATKLQ